MMNFVSYHGRTAFVGELRIQTLKNTGTGEDFEKKTIDFRIAVPKSVAPVKVVKDGVEVMEVPTDYFYCQATGKTAEVIAEHCSDKKEGGKIVSREILVQGHNETFKVDKKVEFTQKTKINGVIYEVPCSKVIQVDVEKCVVEKLDFCGPKPDSTKVVEAKPVEVADEDIPEAKPVTEAPASAPAKTGKSKNAEKPAENVDTSSDITSTISEEGVSIPEGYNGEGAPF